MIMVLQLHKNFWGVNMIKQKELVSTCIWQI